ncbi:MAG: hypothetical protein ACKVU4_13860 [Phycisphaerales bacterium]
MGVLCVRGWWRAAAAVSAALLLGACSGPSMGKYNIELTLAPDVASAPGGPPPISVDIVGLNDTQVGAWSGYRISRYWSPGDRLRSEAASFRVGRTFGPSSPGPQTLARTDPVWATWKQNGAMHLCVIADLPGAQSGDTDLRRIVIPLDQRRWDVETIKITVYRSQLMCTTPWKPEPK